MRFALLGDHPDGLDMARALVASGRHELSSYSGPAVGLETLRRWDLRVPNVADLEEVLADPAIEAVIVAGPPGDRANQLRRALQSERHVLCVHPADQSADAAYEASMTQGDTRRLLMPLLPDGLHPAVARLAELIQAAGGFRLLELERWATELLLLDADTPGHKPGLPDWDVLRVLGGEIAEVFAFAAGEEVVAEEPLLVAGRFENGGLFQQSFVPRQPEPRWRLAVLTTYDRLALVFPEGWPGPAQLTWRDERGEAHEEHFEAWNPWAALVEVFDAAFEPRSSPLLPVAVGAADNTAISTQAIPNERETADTRQVTWHDAIRCLELDDAARRSVQRRRSSTMDYQEATEEAGFKGTMTLVGCGLLWACVLLLILSRWLPWISYLMVAVFGIFLVMQLLRWVVADKPTAGTPPAKGPGIDDHPPT